MFEIRKTVLNSLSFNFRVLLSFIFILISVSSVVIIFSITSTVKKEILNNIENMGAYVLNLDVSIYDKDEHDTSRNITYQDLLSIKRGCKAVKKIAMRSLGEKGGSSHQVIIEGKSKYFIGPPQGLIVGTLPDYRDIKCLKVIKGRFINELDIKLKRRVCVIGNTVYTSLREKNVIGKKLKAIEPPLPVYISKKETFPVPKGAFTVIGVLASTTPFSLPGVDLMCWLGDNNTVFIPYTIINEVIEPNNLEDKGFLGPEPVLIQIKKDKNYQRNNDKWIKKEGGFIRIHKDVEKEVFEILDILREKYGKDKKFGMYSANRLLDELKSQTKQGNIFIATIGIIALIVSIINILSMMLLSVSNRTNEIGVRRAFGARKRDIFIQFITEGSLIAAVGGIVGIILGITGVQFIGWYTSWKMVIPISGVFLALGAVFIIGILSSFYPALRAANIPPAQAVKYE